MKTRLSIFFVFLLVISVSVFAGKQTKIVILHTNDTHSQVEPLESNNLGGYARRLGVINQIRSEEPNVLLFDAGDFSQGTPFFNFFNGRVEVEAMNRMKYDAVTLGNHEFDPGMDTLAVALKNARFPVVNANYQVENTPLKPYIKPYVILHKGGLKIGVFGIGVDPDGLIFKKNYAGLIFENPIQKAVEVSDLLKNTEKCDLVICLSHIGTINANHAPTDYDMAAATKNIDIIIGGHSHEIIYNRTENNANGKPVIIAQMGKSGANLGRIDLTFEKK